MEVVVLDVWLEEMERTRLRNKEGVADVELYCGVCSEMTVVRVSTLYINKQDIPSQRPN